MVSEVVQKALDGERVWITGAVIQVPDNMAITFDGISCNIEDQNGNLLRAIRESKVEDHPVGGTRCIIASGWTEFHPMKT